MPMQYAHSALWYKQRGAPTLSKAACRLCPPAAVLSALSFCCQAILIMVSLPRVMDSSRLFRLHRPAGARVVVWWWCGEGVVGVWSDVHA